MDEIDHRPTLRIKRQDMQLVLKHSETINHLFSVRVTDITETDTEDSNFVHMVLEWKGESANKVPKISEKLQSYVEKLCSQIKEQHDEASLGGEDSSYDSDFEGEDSKSHQDVSRTVSDTLAAEFSEYVSDSRSDPTNYTAKVEFGLKLGYTEKHVQAALCKLGPNPSQNELLAELIKLGAQSPRTAEPEVGGQAEEGPLLDRNPTGLRPIVVDGSNVAMSHGNKEVFSCKGIKICVDWFKSRGHREITVFVPKWRKEASRPDNLISDQEILMDLEKERIVVFTPSRLVGGKRTVCYDDRYILRLAVEIDGIVVSNDNYRDLVQENTEFRKVVEERTLMYSFVNDRFMPPDDPLGRSGPTLDNFLKVQARRGDSGPTCPYGKKCTYGNKCKYSHPERGSMPMKSVTERLVEHAQKHWQARGNKDSTVGQLKGKSLSVPLSTDDPQRPTTQQHGAIKKIPLTRTKSGNPSCTSSFNSHLDVEGVGKCKSVENILNEKIPGQPLPRTASNHWKGRIGDRYVQAQSQATPRLAATSKFSNAEEKVSGPIETTGNLHRKLERQLSLNPYDHRTGEDWASERQWLGYAPRAPFGGSYWEHQNVTRISSAPGSCLPEAPPQGSMAQRQTHRLSSTSDSHINLCVAEGAHFADTFEPRPWIPAGVPLMCSSGSGVCAAAPTSQSGSHFDSYSKEEARRKLHYHLSSIFPEEQVRAALQMHPNETKPQEICAAILAMFPKQ